MHKFCVIDTENTGLFDYKREADAEGQPRLAELAMLFLDDKLEIERVFQAYVKPDGWTMPAAATEVHGITTEVLEEKGVPVGEVLDAYTAAIDAGYVIVAHNAQHDCKQMRAELRRAGRPDRFQQTMNVCTMRALTDVCKIPPNGNRGGYKFPKLSEAMVFFDLKPSGDHSALADAMDAYALLRKIIELDVLPEPKVHLAKPKDETVTSGGGRRMGKTARKPRGDASALDEIPA